MPKCVIGSQWISVPHTNLPPQQLPGSEHDLCSLCRHSASISIHQPWWQEWQVLYHGAPYLSRCMGDFFTRVSCLRSIIVWSLRGNWFWINWSRCVQSSREDKPWLRRRLFSWAVATDNCRDVMGPPPGSCRRSSFSNSWTHLSAIGFLFLFFTRPSSIWMLWCSRSLSLMRDWNPGAGSVRTTAAGGCMGHISIKRRINASRRVSERSFSTSWVTV